MIENFDDPFKYIELGRANKHQFDVIYGDDGILSTGCTRCGTRILVMRQEPIYIGDIDTECPGAPKEYTGEELQELFGKDVLSWSRKK